VCVEVALQRPDLLGGVPIVRVQPPFGWRTGVGFGDDVGRFGQHPIAADEHRGGPSAAGATHGDPVD